MPTTFAFERSATFFLSRSSKHGQVFHYNRSHFQRWWVVYWISEPTVHSSIESHSINISSLLLIQDLKFSMLNCNVKVIWYSWLLFHLFSFQGFTEGLLWLEPSNEFIITESCITVKVQSSNNCQAIGTRNLSSSLSQESSKIFAVYISITPVIYSSESFVPFEVFGWTKSLLQFFSDSIESYFLFEKPGELLLSVLSKKILSPNCEDRALCQSSPENLVIAGHDQL
jgi:hypothetical protein